MGISTIQSYWGAQIFEAVGLKQAFVDRYSFRTFASGRQGIDIAPMLVRHQMYRSPGGHVLDGRPASWRDEANIIFSIRRRFTSSSTLSDREL
jgi:hypothetical protein